jgi:hypothetical protein
VDANRHVRVQVQAVQQCLKLEFSLLAPRAIRHIFVNSEKNAVPHHFSAALGRVK